VGEGRRAFMPLSEGGSAEKATSNSGSPAIERTAAETARLKGSEGFSGLVAIAGNARRYATSTFAALSGNSSPKARW